ncbi:MAG: hypothetical protein JRG79_08205 [Deltaproteobacteria bacterium]|nr:hypothetical protein [Deltaproteobacteria bacterium]
MDQEFETGVVEVDLFPEDVDDRDHPEVVKFMELLLDVAEEYSCELISFEIEKGSVSFSFDSNELTANILRMLQDKGITD